MEPTPFAEMFGETEDLFEARPPLFCFSAVLSSLCICDSSLGECAL